MRIESNPSPRILSAGHSRLLPVLVAAVGFATPTLGAASKLTVEASAIEKALNRQVFKDKGKYYLGKKSECNDPHLETPTVTLTGGRIHVRAHLAGRIGTASPAGCIGASDSSWLTVSGKPYFRDGTLGLSEIRVDKVEKPYLAQLMEGLVVRGAGEGLKFNLKQAIQDALDPARTSPYALGLQALNVSHIAAESNRLVLDVDLALTAK